METSDHFKNGATPKSQTSRKLKQNNMTPEEFFDEVEQVDLEITSDENADEISVALKLSESFDKAEVLRIEEQVSHGWSGVSSCGHSDRIKSEAAQALEAWAKNKIFQYRHLRYIRYGHLGGSARTSSSGGSWGQPRRCRGSLTIKCYIEFIKP